MKKETKMSFVDSRHDNRHICNDRGLDYPEVWVDIEKDRLALQGSEWDWEADYCPFCGRILYEIIDNGLYEEKWSDD